MRAFVVLAIIAVARADVSGYTYGTGSNGGYVSGGFEGSSISGGAIGDGATDSGLGDDASDDGGSSLGSSSLGGVEFDAGHYSAPTPVEYTKDFFTYSAPEEEFDNGQNLDDFANSLKKNLQVVFIRGPESNGLSDATLNLAKSAAEQNTAIYVLTKKSDSGDLTNQLHNLNENNAYKPEVHFVKYRTPEDAGNAQRAIQDQYKNLGGTSHFYDEGIAQVLNFVSKAPVAHVGHDAPENTYIPPSAVRSPSATYLPIFRF